MYSPERPVTLEFIQVLCDQKDGTDLKSIFRKGVYMAVRWCP